MYAVLAALIVFFSGIASGLLGIGGGLILVPLFHYLLKMNIHMAIGTSLAIIVPTALIGAFRHAGSHYVDFRVFIFTFLFAILGAYLGASISISLDVVLLKKIFAVFLILVALKMFLQ